ARAPGGTESRVTSTSNVTAPLLPAALPLGAIEATVPWTVWLSAVRVIEAFWPTVTRGTSLSTTPVVISSAVEATLIAVPLGAPSRDPALPAVTTPAAGAVRLA